MTYDGHKMITLRQQGIFLQSDTAINTAQCPMVFKIVNPFHYPLHECKTPPQHNQIFHFAIQHLPSKISKADMEIFVIGKLKDGKCLICDT